MRREALSTRLMGWGEGCLGERVVAEWSRVKRGGSAACGFWPAYSRR